MSWVFFFTEGVYQSWTVMIFHAKMENVNGRQFFKMQIRVYVHTRIIYITHHSYVVWSSGFSAVLLELANIRAPYWRLFFNNLILILKSIYICTSRSSHVDLYIVEIKKKGQYLVPEFPLVLYFRLDECWGFHLRHWFSYRDREPPRVLLRCVSAGWIGG